MATPVVMPLLGMTMEEGVISRWLVSDGATVKAGQPILAIETDKINADIESPANGVLGGIVAREGQAVKVQGLLAYVLAPGEQPPAMDTGPAGALEPSPAALAAPPTPATAASVAPPHAAIRVGAHPKDSRREATVAAALPRVPSEDSPPKISPLARTLARELGVDVRHIRGSGPGGRVVEKDVRAAAEAHESVAQVAAAVPVRAAPVAPLDGAAIPLRGARRVIAERMTQSLREMAQLTLVTEAHATNFHSLRTQLAARHEPKLGFKIAYNDLLVLICARALREHPRVNATIVGDEIRLLDYVNVGVAVEAGQDLVVPNVKHADRKGLVEIATEFRACVERARANQLTLEDITGGTFTITNLGQYGVEAFTPIINPPEAAILGVGRLAEKPAVVNGQVVPRLSVTLSLTIDHRLVDGAPGARFLGRVKELIEQPYLML